MNSTSGVGSLAAAFATEASRRSAGTTLSDHVLSLGALLAVGFYDRVAQRQPGKENVFALSNGRGASFYSSSEPLASEDYLVCFDVDGSDKKYAELLSLGSRLGLSHKQQFAGLAPLTYPMCHPRLSGLLASIWQHLSHWPRSVPCSRGGVSRGAMRPF
jgi:hypothetical protein